MTLPEQVKQQLTEIPGQDGWWNSSGQAAYEELAGELLGAGLAPDTVVDVLTRAYAAAAAEYGD